MGWSNAADNPIRKFHSVSTEPSPLVDHHGSNVLWTVFHPLRITSGHQRSPQVVILTPTSSPTTGSARSLRSSQQSAVGASSLFRTPIRRRTPRRNVRVREVLLELRSLRMSSIASLASSRLRACGRRASHQTKIAPPCRHYFLQD